MDMKRLNTRERIILRMIYALGTEPHIWRIRTNQELRELHKELHTVTGIKKETIVIDWIGLDWTGLDIK